MKELQINKEKYKEFFIKLLIILLFLSGIAFFYQILNIIFILFFSLFLTVLFSPFLNKFNKWKINDLAGISIIFLILILIVLIFLLSVVPLIVGQGTDLLDSISKNAINWQKVYKESGIEGFGFPTYIEDSLRNINLENIFDLIRNNASQISTFIGSNLSNVLTRGAGIISSVGTSIFNFVMIFIFTFFIVLERKRIRKFFYSILPQNISKYIYDNEKDVVNTLFIWLKGQLILGIAMFFLTLIGLLILKIFGINIEGIFTLALIAGFMEFIPYVGTFFSITIALIVALGGGVETFIGVLVVYLIIQQIEGNLLVPYIMGKTLSLSPFLVLISMLIGGALFGIIGIIFTIPVLCVLQVFLKPYIKKREKENYFIK